MKLLEFAAYAGEPGTGFLAMSNKYRRLNLARTIKLATSRGPWGCWWERGLKRAGPR